MSENYVSPDEQLIIEVYTSNYQASVAFYLQYGFRLVRDEGNFAELGWDDSRLFIEAVEDAPVAPLAVANLRVMVADVDAYWQLAQKQNAEVIRPLAERYYGLKDFTIAGPDGIGLRFATKL